MNRTLMHRSIDRYGSAPSPKRFPGASCSGYPRASGWSGEPGKPAGPPRSPHLNRRCPSVAERVKAAFGEYRRHSLSLAGPRLWGGIRRAARTQKGRFCPSNGHCAVQSRPGSDEQFESIGCRGRGTSALGDSFGNIDSKRQKALALEVWKQRWASDGGHPCWSLWRCELLRWSATGCSAPAGSEIGARWHRGPRLYPPELRAHGSSYP